MVLLQIINIVRCLDYFELPEIINIKFKSYTYYIYIKKTVGQTKSGSDVINKNSNLLKYVIIHNFIIVIFTVIAVGRRNAREKILPHC